MPDLMSKVPILWSFRRCPYAMRARLALLSSGNKVELREILLRDKPEVFLKTSPKATVPVLDLGDGEVLEQSRDIMLWALRRHDPENWLHPWRQNQPAVLAFLDRLDGDFKHHLDRYKYASRFDGGAAQLHRDKGAEFLAAINQQLSQRPALSGAVDGLMDYAALPFVRQFRIADPDWFDAQGWPFLHRWLQAFLNSTQFRTIMTKFPIWTPDSVPVIFPNKDQKKRTLDGV